MSAHVAQQCTAPNGQRASFLWRAPSADLNWQFIGPKDARKLASPVFADSAALFDWIQREGLEREPSLMGRVILPD